jgi:hypothetical protein
MPGFYHLHPLLKGRHEAVEKHYKAKHCYTISSKIRTMENMQAGIKLVLTPSTLEDVLEAKSSVLNML